MTKTVTRASRNAAPVAASMSALAAEKARADGATADLTQAGYAYGVAEAKAACAANAVLAVMENDDLLARAFFSYGYVVSYLLRWNKSAKAVEAARADNPDWQPVYNGDKLANFPPVYGPAMLAYGKSLIQRGKSPTAQKIKTGEFRMTEFEQAAVKASNSAWRRVAPPKVSGEETATRAPQAAGSKAKAEAPTFAQLLEPKNLPKVNGTKAVCELAFKLAQLEAAIAKKHANELPLEVKELIAKLETALRKTWDSVKDA